MITLNIDLEPHSDDGALETLFTDHYLPALRRQPGFRSACLLRAFDATRRREIDAAELDHGYELHLEFDTEWNRRAWVASQDHNDAWSQLTAISQPLRHRGYDVLASGGRDTPPVSGAEDEVPRLLSYLSEDQLVRAKPTSLNSTAGNETSELAVWLGGTGTPLISHKRSGPCVALGLGGRTILIDCGNGTPQQLSRLDLQPSSVSHVLLTHLHIDHVADLAYIIMSPWVMKQETDPVHVVGPPGTRAFLDRLLLAYDYDVRARLPHGFDPSVLAPYVSEVSDGARWMIGKTSFTAFEVDHRPVPDALGYRVNQGSGGASFSVVVSGDTKPNDNLIRYAADCDLLIHEALMPGHGISSYHTTVDDAARIASKCGARRLVLTHLLPGHLPDEDWLVRVRPHFDGDVVVGRDLMRLA